MRYIEILILQFLNNFHRYFYTTSVFIARDIIEADEKCPKKVKEELKFIWNNTTPELKVPISIVEAYYINNWIRLSKTIEMRNNEGRVIELPIYKLKKYLDEAYVDIRNIVRQVAIKYSLDIPFKEIGVGKQGEEIRTS